MLRKDGEKIYIKYARKDFNQYVFSIISIIISGIVIFLFLNNIETAYKGLNIALRSNFLKIFFIIGIIIYFIISITDILFFSNYDYHINTRTKNIYLINGRWKHKKEIILNFENIKYIVLFEYVELEEDKKYQIFKIDIYDYELNAYEIYEHKNYNIIREMALEIKKYTNIEINDRTDVENYEGFRQRIL